MNSKRVNRFWTDDEEEVDEVEIIAKNMCVTQEETEDSTRHTRKHTSSSIYIKEQLIYCLENFKSKAVSNDGSLFDDGTDSFVFHHVGRLIPQPLIVKSVDDGLGNSPDIVDGCSSSSNKQ